MGKQEACKGNPFARRDDGDDIACFEMKKGNSVQIKHDFANEG